ncbi:MAG: pyrroline-5-carboxylate reductase, partial [Clostridia bacterium]|nr:pyrroline-5-carboxylate reductase [Clostridia bacterium]
SHTVPKAKAALKERQVQDNRFYRSWKHGIRHFEWPPGKAGSEPDGIFVSRKHPENAQSYARQGVHILRSNSEVVQSADTILLAVKPNILESVLEEIRGSLSERHLLVSIAAGWPPERLLSAVPEEVSCICAMPNVPASVGNGWTILNEKGRYRDEQMETVRTIFNAVGTTHLVDDRYYSVCGSLTGCSPAFVFEFIESLCDAAVLNGIPKPLALSLAAEMLSGSAQMVLKTGQHPGALKDRVCSPGGTTSEGIRALHEHGFHAAVMMPASRLWKKENASSLLKN